MRSKKRGAIELSMTTIIVIVLGVTLLSLGLIFVRGVFEKVEGLSKGAFQRADVEIGRIGEERNAFINLIPSKVEINQKSSATADIILANLQDTDISAVQGKVTSSDPKVICAFASTLKDTTDFDGATISSGEELKDQIIIEDKGSALGNKVCKITVEPQGVQVTDKTENLIISIVKN